MDCCLLMDGDEVDFFGSVFVVEKGEGFNVEVEEIVVVVVEVEGAAEAVATPGEGEEAYIGVVDAGGEIGVGGGGGAAETGREGGGAVVVRHFNFKEPCVCMRMRKGETIF